MPISFNKLFLGGGAGGFVVGKVPADVATTTTTTTTTAAPTTTTTTTAAPGPLYAGTYLFTWNAGDKSGNLNPNSEHQMDVVGDATFNDWASLTDVYTGASSTNVAGGFKSDGSLWMWGQGNSSPTYSFSYNASSPVQELSRRTDWMQVIIGTNNAAGVTSNNELLVWGLNSLGQLGLGDTLYRTVAVSHPDKYWSKVFGGANTTFAIKTDGTLWGWGSSSAGQLGNNSAISRSSPVQISSATDWHYVSCGLDFTLALRGSSSSYTLWAWGNNNVGQLGDGTKISKSSPVQIGSGNDWSYISAGSNAAVGIRSANNYIWAWGANTSGQLGDGTAISKSSPIQIPANSNINWNGVRMNPGNSYQLRINDGVYQTGYGVYPTIDYTARSRSSPIQIMSNSTGEWYEISSIGANNIGFLVIANVSGDTKPTTTTTPAPAKQAGYLWAWGYHKYTTMMEQFEPGSTNPQPSPVIISASNDWKAFPENTTFDYAFGVITPFMAAIKTDNTLWLWGENAYGIIGDPSVITNTSSPVQVMTGGSWSEVALAQFAVAGIKKDGTLWTWGRNYYGELGLGDKIHRSSPCQVGTDSNWTSVAACTRAGRFHAINSYGQIWSWGGGTQGGLGINSTTHRSSPVQVIADATFTKVVCSTLHVLALDNTDKLWVWGLNTSGQLGINTNQLRSSPVLISASTTWLDISCSGNTTFAIKTDNTLWAWGAGSNSGGVLSLNKSSPVQVGMSNYNYQTLKGVTCLAYEVNTSRAQLQQLGGNNATIGEPLMNIIQSQMFPLDTLTNIRSKNNPPFAINEINGFMIS